jgi:hypothetical protein
MMKNQAQITFKTSIRNFYVDLHAKWQNGVHTAIWWGTVCSSAANAKKFAELLTFTILSPVPRHETLEHTEETSEAIRASTY